MSGNKLGEWVDTSLTNKAVPYGAYRVYGPDPSQYEEFESEEDAINELGALVDEILAEGGRDCEQEAMLCHVGYVIWKVGVYNDGAYELIECDAQRAQETAEIVEFPRPKH